MKKTIIALALVLAACGGVNREDEAAAPAAAAVGREASDAIPSTPPPTMGKVVAMRYADLSFESALPVERVLVSNGQPVQRGQLLAVLDLFTLQSAVSQQELALEQARLQIEQAGLQMQDVLISQGYDPQHPDAIPAEVRRNADVKSGYALAQSHLSTVKAQLEAARHALAHGQLTAPFDGIVANLDVQPHQLAQPGQTVCRVIASGDMAVEFHVMEADLRCYPLGTVVGVTPLADTTLRRQATICEINPVVDSQGTVTLRARLSSPRGLYDGMNAEVKLEASSTE